MTKGSHPAHTVTSRYNEERAADLAAMEAAAERQRAEHARQFDAMERGRLRDGASKRRSENPSRTRPDGSAAGAA
jgi:hypothetical protein